MNYVSNEWEERADSYYVGGASVYFNNEVKMEGSD